MAKSKTETKDSKETKTPKKTPSKKRASTTENAADKATEKCEKSEIQDVSENASPKAQEPEMAATRALGASCADADQPDVAENERVKRYDVMITSERAGYRPPKAAVMAMVQQLAFRGLASPVDEALAETWAEIYFEPGPSAHEIFLEKEYNSDLPVYQEMAMRFCEKPFYCDYSDTPKRPLYWGIEVRGSRFTNPLGSFRKLFLDALNLRVAVAVRPAEPIPPHLVVPEDELPVDKKKRERGRGLAGTEVEEV